MNKLAFRQYVIKKRDQAQTDLVQLDKKFEQLVKELEAGFSQSNYRQFPEEIKFWTSEVLTNYKELVIAFENWLF